MPEPTNPYEYPVHRDASGECGDIRMSISTHGFVRVVVGFVGFWLVALFCASSAIAFAIVTGVFLGDIRAILMIGSMVLAAIATMFITAWGVSCYDRIPARCSECNDRSFRSDFREKRYRCSQCGREQKGGLFTDG